jgi:hypothetical protein
LAGDFERFPHEGNFESSKLVERHGEHRPQKRFREIANTSDLRGRSEVFACQLARGRVACWPGESFNASRLSQLSETTMHAQSSWSDTCRQACAACRRQARTPQHVTGLLLKLSEGHSQGDERPRPRSSSIRF